ncbi:MAG: hypothetical protein DHS20C18_52900 [Saprospiraceae bacterium]|nr:MAG: hypothetical protein DHS20C18_52900 [Saprospiraceae bacterium]
MPTPNWQAKVDVGLLEKLNNGASIDFLVVLREQSTVNEAKTLQNKAAKGQFVYQKLKTTAERTQKNIRAILQNEGVYYKSFVIVNSIYTQGDLALVSRLAQLNEVQSIQSNPQIHLEVPEVSRDGVNSRDLIEWGIERINADDVWAMGYTGQNVVVGGADTGVAWEHTTIQSKYRGWNAGTPDHNYNWHDGIHVISPLHNDSIISPDNNPCGLESIVPCDDNNHGTHTVGTMVGDDGEGNQIGVAPGSSWVACRNMERGWGSPASYIECFEWFLAPTDLAGENPDPAMAPHVINNSWSCPEVEGCNATNWGTMETVVNNLKAAGIVVVVSAGNSGSSCGSVSTPAAMFEASFTVGATQPSDTIAGFSSRGVVTVDNSFRLKPNVAAPGVSVRSAVRNGGFATWNGTSMAGPHVAGLVALIISANPALAGQVDIIEDIIESSALPILSDQDCGEISGMSVPNAVYGYGRVDALAAVEQALQLVKVKDPSTYATVQIAPNPANKKVRVNLIAPAGNATLEIFTLTGLPIYYEQWHHVNGSEQLINISSWFSGIYVYRLKIGGERLIGRIIKG